MKQIFIYKEKYQLVNFIKKLNIDIGEWMSLH